ncbi:MAG TPA: HD domain-containing protein [Pyrinomonadaceae bacterium]|nr:HD domain-containing protein [Pyrinomonadaceae bacterium]
MKNIEDKHFQADWQGKDFYLLAKIIAREGGRAMLVGGCVRDELMGRKPKDWDLEVYGIKPERLKQLLDDFSQRERLPLNTVGEIFTVYKLGSHLDVSIPRRERKSGRGHRAFIVEGDPEMSFEEACLRRDFTINAILLDPLSGEIVDPFDGRKDIEKRVIRHVSEKTFPEDSLRVLRAAQLASRFEFEIDPETISLCKAIDLTDLPAERIFGEVEKILLLSEKPSIGFGRLYELGVVEKLFPELAALKGVPQEPDWHPEGDVDVHTLMVLDEARKLIDDLDHARKLTVMIAALCHDLGKPSTTQLIDGRIRSRGHDEAGVEPTISLLDRLGIYTKNGFNVRQQVVELVRYHLLPGEWYKSKTPVGDGAFRRLARKVEPDLLYRVAKADSLGRNPDWLPEEKRFGSEAQEWFIGRVRELKIEKAAPKPILQGRHLIEMGLEPSPKFGKILSRIYEMQLDGEISDLEDAKKQAQRMLNNADKSV